MKLKIFLFTLIALLMFSSFASAAETKDYKLTAPEGKTNLTYTKDFYNELGDLKIEVENTGDTFPADTTISVKVSYDAVFKSTSDSTKTVDYKLVYGDNKDDLPNDKIIKFTFTEAASSKTIKIGAVITGDSSGVPDGGYTSNITFVGLPVKGQKNYEFGEYNNAKIKWRVLYVDETNKRALLVTERALFDSKFDDSNNNWISSYLYKYLNSIDNYTSPITFTKEESSRIYTDNNIGRIFLLSKDEANNTSYFSGNDDRKCNNGTCNWWLRSPGHDDDRATFVNGGGDVLLYGDYVSSVCAVRPAVWIDLN